jgi:hypothetical protein
MLVNIEANLTIHHPCSPPADIQGPKDKGVKSKPKAQSKAHAKKSARRRSPGKNYSNNGTLDTDESPENHHEAGALTLALKSETLDEEPQLAGSSSPAPRLFQMALSPADVLHVHSYAKGDYGDDEVQVREKEEGMNYSTDTETDAQDKGVSS